jgi:hypothetical protein
MSGEIYTAAQAVLEDIRAAIDASTTTLPARRVVTVGQIPWGGCDQLVVSMGALFPTNNFPVPAVADPGAGCGPALLGVNMTLSVIRCFPTITDQGAQPSADALAAITQTLAIDGQTISTMLPCSLQDLVDANTLIDYTVGMVPVIGPDGGRVSLEAGFQLCVRRG